MFLKPLVVKFHKQLIYWLSLFLSSLGEEEKAATALTTVQDWPLQSAMRKGLSNGQ